MPTLAGLLDHPPATGQAFARNAASPMASSTSGATGSNGTSGAGTNSATVSANDFLTLLVTEMKNQDPTANTDPNEYINQLVNVNSLEQLIDINQTLSSALGAPPSTSNHGASPQVTTEATNAGTSASPAAPTLRQAPHAAAAPTASNSQASSIFGNLSAPAANPAAARVGHALTQSTRCVAGGGSLLAR